MLSVSYLGRSVHLIRGLTFILLSVVPLQYTFLNAQATGSSKLKLLSNVVVEDANFNLEYKRSAVSLKNGTLWLVFGRRPAGLLSGPQELVLRSLTYAGKMLSETPLNAMATAAGLDPALNQFIDLAITADDNLAIVLGSIGRASVVIVDAKSRQVIVAKDIKGFSANVVIRRALSMPGGSLLLLGNVGSRGVVIKLDRDLGVDWQKLADPGEASLLTDGLVFSDETFILIGNSVMGPSSVDVSIWIGLYGTDGQVTKSILIPGLSATVAGAPDRGCAVIQELSKLTGSEFWLRTYDRNLKETWSTSLYTGARSFTPVLAAAIPQSRTDYITVGSEKRHLQISRVHAGSSVLWSESPAQGSTAPPTVWNFGAVSTTSSVVVMSTEFVMYTSPEGLRQRQVLKIMNVDTR